MDMAPYSLDGGDADWYRALDSFPPLLCSSASPLALSEEDNNLLNAVVPRSLRNDPEGSDHGPLLLAADSSSSAMILRDDDSCHLSLFSAPAPLAAADPFYFDLLPPIPANGATAGLDDALMLQPFSDIDLDAFGGGDEHKAAAPLTVDNMMIVPADRHHVYAARQDAGVDAAHVDQKPIATADCYRQAASSVVGFDMIRHGEHATPAVAALPPPPMPRRPLARRTGDRSVVPQMGKTRLDHIGFEEIRKYFYMPITKAAREMNVGLTVLKKRCRELGVARWPHRKMKSLRSLMLNVQEMGKGMSPTAVQRELAALETYCALMEEDPSIELTERTKKLRQACFKESYKRRRAASVSGVIDHIYNFGHGHQLALQETNSTAGGRILQSSHFYS